MALMISILTFAAVAAIVLIISLLASTDSHQDLIRRRMDAVTKAEKRGGNSLGLKLLRDEMLSSVPLLHRWMSRWPWFGRMRIFLTQAGMKSEPAKFLLLCGVFAFSGYVAAAHTIATFRSAHRRGRGGRPSAGRHGLVQAPPAPEQFEEHFPEALDLLGRAVAPGMPSPPAWK